MGPIGFPETSVQKYQSTLRNTPEERRSHQYRCGSLKSRIVFNDVSNCLVSFILNLCYFFPKRKHRAVKAVKRVVKQNIVRGRKSERLVSLEINDKQKVCPVLLGTSKKNTQSWPQVRTK